MPLQTSANLNPDLQRYNSLLIFGGTFDPPHVAHVMLPQQVRQRLGLDVIAYIPTARSPHKNDQPLADADHRLAMLQLALRDVAHAIILTDELDMTRAGEQPTYTVDTLARLRRRIKPNAVMRLLIGADQMRAFDRWHQSQRVMAMAEPVVMIRPPDDAASLLADLPEDARQTWKKRIIELPPMDVSATAIRDRIGRGEPIDQYVHPDVARYIEQHRLY